MFSPPLVDPDIEPAGDGTIPEGEWRERATAHGARAAALTAGHRERKLRGERHPVEDFLWTYYSVKPTELARWHPGGPARLPGAAAERGDWRHYRASGGAAEVDLPAYFARRGGTVDYVETLLRATIAHPP